MEPKAELNFLELLLKTAALAGGSASGPQRVVVGFYESQFEARKRVLERRLSPHRRRG